MVRHVYIAAGIVALALILALFVGAYTYTAKSGAALQQLRQDMQAIRDRAEADRRAAEERERIREQQLSITLSAIAAQRTSPVTADQVAQLVVQRMGSVKVDTHIPQTNDGKPLPNAPSSVVIEGENAAQKFRDYMLDCTAAGIERDSCKQGLANKDAIISTLKTDKETLTKERDVAVKVARGGGFWSRAKSGAKYFIIGGLVGAGAVAATR